ncbi:hypothetical protein BD408DRAFT_467729, partial [Parasitella parasitica]
NSLTRKKKTNEKGTEFWRWKRILEKIVFINAQQLMVWSKPISYHTNSRASLRSFYYNQSMIKRRRRLELSCRKGFHRLAAYEKKSSGAKRLIMFVGDRGHGFGSRIKRHGRFGGFWKQQQHGGYTPTLITNEHNTSQTCIFCFHKLSHSTMCRDQVSAFAIGLAGLGCLLFEITFPCFDPNPTTAKQFNNLALYFCTENRYWARLSMKAILFEGK